MQSSFTQIEEKEKVMESRLPRILIAEDEAPIQVQWIQALHQLGFKDSGYLIVGNAHHARIKLERAMDSEAERFDVLITDLNMPGGPYDGLELIRKIGRKPAFDTLRIHLATSHIRGDETLTEEVCLKLESKGVKIWDKSPSYFSPKDILLSTLQSLDAT